MYCGEFRAKIKPLNHLHLLLVLLTEIGKGKFMISKFILLISPKNNMKCTSLFKFTLYILQFTLGVSNLNFKHKILEIVLKLVKKIIFKNWKNFTRKVIGKPKICQIGRSFMLELLSI